MYGRLVIDADDKRIRPVLASFELLLGLNSFVLHTFPVLETVGAPATATIPQLCFCISKRFNAVQEKISVSINTTENACRSLH